MAVAANTVIELVRQYIGELQKHDICIKEAILFGSYAKGNPKEESDIDVALISDSFTGDRFDDRRKIVPLRRNIDVRIEPMPFNPADFYNGDILAEEIRRTGKKLTWCES